MEDTNDLASNGSVESLMAPSFNTIDGLGWWSSFQVATFDDQRELLIADALHIKSRKMQLRLQRPHFRPPLTMHGDAMNIVGVHSELYNNNDADNISYFDGSPSISIMNIWL
jgi:hypothetical protein